MPEPETTNEAPDLLDVKIRYKYEGDKLWIKKDVCHSTMSRYITHYGNHYALGYNGEPLFGLLRTGGMRLYFRDIQAPFFYTLIENKVWDAEVDDDDLGTCITKIADGYYRHCKSMIEKITELFFYDIDEPDKKPLYKEREAMESVLCTKVLSLINDMCEWFSDVYDDIPDEILHSDDEDAIESYYYSQFEQKFEASEIYSHYPDVLKPHRCQWVEATEKEIEGYELWKKYFPDQTEAETIRE